MIWAEKLLDVVLLGFELAKCEHKDASIGVPICVDCGATKQVNGQWRQPRAVAELSRALEGQETVFRLGIMHVAGKVGAIADAFKKRREP